MSRIRFYTDEDIYGQIAPALRQAGFDAVSAVEAGRLGEDDLSQLEWAVKHDRVIVTFNLADFARLHHKWMNDAHNHSGIAVSAQRTQGDLLRRLCSLGAVLSAEEMMDRLEFLGNWSIHGGHPACQLHRRAAAGV